MAEYQAFVNFGPGDSIKEELAYYGWDQKALAEILGKTGRVSEIKIRHCAERLGLHPAIVRGCLQHHGRASYKALHKLKPKASALLPDDCKIK